MRGKIRAKVLIYVKLIFLIAGGGECTGRLQNCYMDAGIDPTGGINPNITWYFDDLPSDIDKNKALIISQRISWIMSYKNVFTSSLNQCIFY